jgi:hypothetical protein
MRLIAWWVRQIWSKFPSNWIQTFFQTEIWQSKHISLQIFDGPIKRSSAFDDVFRLSNVSGLKQVHAVCNKFQGRIRPKIYKIWPHIYMKYHCRLLRYICILNWFLIFNCIHFPNKQLSIKTHLCVVMIVRYYLLILPLIYLYYS